jgi:prepilin-type N-terminal cleavage/methylation domain-containing protein
MDRQFADCQFGMIRRRGTRRGFTVIELLVVIIIIAILMSILVPVISHVKIAAHVADTKNEMSQLTTAINNYYADFHAYPGPFSNDQIEQDNTAPGMPDGIPNFYTYINTAYAAVPTAQAYVTGSENLVLGLLGGLRLNPANGDPTFAPAEVGLGPLSLNPANPKRYSPYLSANYLMWTYTPAGGQPTQSQTLPTDPTTLTNFADQAQAQARDSIIPEFVDRFPTPMPILYLRARTGAKGVVSDGITPDYNTPANRAAYQYDTREIYGYTNLNSHIGLSPTYAHLLANNAGYSGDTSGFTFLKGSAFVTVGAAGQTRQISGGAQTGGFPPDAGIYFLNQSTVSATAGNDAYIDYNGQPHSVDEFILISAGPDGIYGTYDDITSFGDVAQ